MKISPSRRRAVLRQRLSTLLAEAPTERSTISAYHMWMVALAKAQAAATVHILRQMDHGL